MANTVGDSKLTLTLTKVSALEVLKLTAELANLELDISEHVFVLKPKAGADPETAIPGYAQQAP